MNPLQRLIPSPRRAAKAAYLLACVWLAACSTTYNPRSYLRGGGELRDTRGNPLPFTASCFTQHIVAVDRDGLLLHPGLKPYTNRQDWIEYFRVLTNSVATSPLGTNILIFVHGGLNTRLESFERATNLWWRLQVSRPAYYPIFLNWDSDLFSSYWEHLHRVRQGQVVGWSGWLSAPFYLLADLGRGITRAPVVFYQNLRSDTMELADSSFLLASAGPRFMLRQATNNLLRPVAAAGAPLSQFLDKAERPAESWLNAWLAPDALNAAAIYHELQKRYTTNAVHAIAVSMGGEQRPRWQRVGRAGLYVATLPIKMAGQSLVLDSLGTSAWDNMYRRTRTMFRQPGEFDVSQERNDSAKLRQRLTSPPTGAVAEFMRHLGALIAASNRNYQITLIGHSMGTIVLNELIRSYPNLPYTNIVYLAAACSMRDLESSVVPYLAAHPGATFYNVCLHPKNDVFGICVPGDLGPRGTLLQWIDNFFSSPLTMQDRTLGNWYNLMQETHVFPTNLHRQIKLKAFGVGSDSEFPEGNPQQHQDFGTNIFWAPAFWSPHPPTNPVTGTTSTPVSKSP
ncbi:MAG: hypothetical protein N2689_02145 [Verrucomicrobiae bacterium]|nr:hypothetical protein [Verrucomicrobiae bacterium]